MFQCCPYPSDEDFQHSLQTSVDWEAYKMTTFKETLTHLITKAQRNNMRAGPITLS